ncbi:MAG TPA: hypothetical protein VGE24_11010 [Emticicia sp.]
MKKLIILLLCVLSLTTCIKKKALKYDPDLVGTWVGTEGSELNYWIRVYDDGKATFRTLEYGEDNRYSGSIKYSVFELKMWIGSTKFKVKEWLTADMKGVYELEALDWEKALKKKYTVDRRMVLRTTLFNDFRLITFYRIVE